MKAAYLTLKELEEVIIGEYFDEDPCGKTSISRMVAVQVAKKIADASVKKHLLAPVSDKLERPLTLLALERCASYFDKEDDQALVQLVDEAIEAMRTQIMEGA